ncbi:MAG: hypothetical protein WA116_03290 [Anaerolineaceae bacterium]
MTVYFNGEANQDFEVLSPDISFNNTDNSGVYPSTVTPSVEKYKWSIARPGEKVIIGISSAYAHATIVSCQGAC